MLRAAYESVLSPDPYNAWPRHHHCFGASLAVTAETYLAAGGVPAVPCLEDMAFGRSLERIGAIIVAACLRRIVSETQTHGVLAKALADRCRGSAPCIGAVPTRQGRP